MLNASRTLRAARDEGARLPEIEVLRPLYDKGVVLREGQLVMIAGRSGGGKSTLAQWLLAMLKDLPSLYIAADMEKGESISRLIATLSGASTATIMDQMEIDAAVDYYQEEYLDNCNIQFSFQENPSVADIYLELDAFIEAYDAFPKLIVIDNLVDVDAGDESYQGQLWIMQELRNLAKRTGAMVIILAHTKSKDGDNGFYPQPRSEILNKVDQKPQLILTLGREGDIFRIAVVKDRNSKAQDVTGKTYIELGWQGDTASFGPFDADWHRYSGGGS